MTLRDAILEATGIDVLEHRDRDALVAAIAAASIEMATDDLTWPALVDDLLSKHVEPAVTDPVFIIDYPKELSPFAKDHRSEPGLVERFEAFARRMEIANAFTELNDPDEQRRGSRRRRGSPPRATTRRSPTTRSSSRRSSRGCRRPAVSASGSTGSSMLMTGKRSIREVVLFPAMRD